MTDWQIISVFVAISVPLFLLLIQFLIQRKALFYDIFSQNILNNIVYIFIMGVFLAIVPTFLVEWIGFYILPYLIFNVFVYLYYSYRYGKRWPQLSWIIGICFTSPWFLLTYIRLGHYAHGDGLIALQYFIISGCIYLIFSCIGGYIGARLTRKKELKL